MKDLIQLQLRQLERLVALKRVSPQEAFMVIFSDYASKSFLERLIAENYKFLIQNPNIRDILDNLYITTL